MSSRRQLSKNTNEEENTVSKSKKFDNSWMFLAKDNVFEPNSWSTIINITHPRYDKTAKYLIKKSSNMLYEMQTFNEPNRSWFIGETVKSDGSIYILTPMDPVFLILPHLISQCSSRAIPLEQLLMSSNNKDDLKELADINIDLKCVADLKGPIDICAYKYNEEKTLKWLEAKTRRLADAVKAEKLHVKSGAVSATFISSSLKEEEEDEELYLKYAYGIVSEYLTEELSKKLWDRFNFKAEAITTLGGGNKRKSDADKSIGSKRVKKENENDKSAESQDDKKENVEMVSDYFNGASQAKPSKPIVLSAKDKQLQKAASGTKNIMSFFAKK